MSKSKKITIKTGEKITPKVYAYTIPDYSPHEGWVKIGYTAREVETRLAEQSGAADIEIKKQWDRIAIFKKSRLAFDDHDFHRYLAKKEVERRANTEWFKISVEDSEKYIDEFIDNDGLDIQDYTIPEYKLREEQQEAVESADKYFVKNEDGHPEFLWNAKPRFGKTLSTYDLCKKLDAKRVLIITNRPAIANSWYSDYVKFLGLESGYRFISSADALKDKRYVLTREDYVSKICHNNKEDEDSKYIEFVSLQDLKGAIDFGGPYKKLEHIRELEWDILVIDEAHEGVDTYRTDIALDNIKRKYTLHLSGTPFKALANDKFEEDAIYNWTYADEQKAKQDWEEGRQAKIEKGEPVEEENPYENLPQLNLFTYQMSSIVREEVAKGIDIDGENENYVFDLNEFFKVKNGEFEHDEEVDKFLDALTKQEKFPFSTEELRNELKHTFWILNRVESAKLLAKKLKEHPIFKDYEIVLAAGDGKLENDDDQEASKKSYDKVMEAIGKHDKTITISVGQLTTGVTVPQWTAVLMLSNMKSPALYMQAAFRAQNPYEYVVDGEVYRKKNAYVFDFDPARTLVIFEEFANGLSPESFRKDFDSKMRKENVGRLLNFFPVIGEDENGEMSELEAGDVLSIPRMIYSHEVVRRGFMCDFLFQNISRIFANPSKEVEDILERLTSVSKSDAKITINDEIREELSVDEDGEVVVKKEIVLGKENKTFGTTPIYEDVTKDIIKSISPSNTKESKKEAKKILKSYTEDVIDKMLETAEDKYGDKFTSKVKKNLENNLGNKASVVVNKAVNKKNIEINKAKEDYETKIKECETKEEKEQVKREHEQKEDEINKAYKENLEQELNNLNAKLQETIIREVETDMRRKEKASEEDKIKDRLRGFARTIPSFLMAYGDKNTTLANFDTIIPDAVFKEITSISLDEFKILRDGWDHEENGVITHMNGLFNEDVFNGSIKEFLELKDRLSDYFDETNTEDIFDYIPPQQTNQIFTPKKVVKEMVDMLEVENPGCFDSTDKTFIDLYMKSGLYIAEIVKRLYNSDGLKKAYPDDNERLKHIFKKQVFGLAPTEIIYKIATNFILGFAEKKGLDKEKLGHNFKMLDTLGPAKEGNLSKKLDEVYEGSDE